MNWKVFWSSFVGTFAGAFLFELFRREDDDAQEEC